MKKPKLKLEYLREIDKNLMLHATQPKEAVFNRYSAPPGILRRIVLTLESLTKSYKQALAMQVKAEKKGGGWGTLAHDLALWQEMGRSLDRTARRRAQNS